jgi:hypothetical protein
MRRYFEFFVVVILLGILGMVLVHQLDKMRSAMEEAGVQAESVNIRAQVLEALTHREAFGGRLPASDNPVDWMTTPPANYRGALDEMPDSVSVWYFDRRQKLLVYRFRDGHAARFRLSRDAGRSESRAVLAGIGLQRLEDQRQ